MILEHPAWMRDAACRYNPDSGLTPKEHLDQFFPVNNSRLVKQTIERYCDNCLVRRQCQDYAVTEVMRFGIWGMSKNATTKRRATGRPPRQQLRDDEGRFVEKPHNHGTEEGYYQHRRKNEPACDACREAHRLRMAEYYRTHPEAMAQRAANAREWRARQKAKSA